MYFAHDGQRALNVLNGNTENFETMPVSIKLECLNGHCQVEVSVLTADKVTGNLKAISWTDYKICFVCVEV